MGKAVHEEREEASILIRCLHVLEGLLERRIYVEHVARLSDPEAVLADHWSRLETITAEDRRVAAGFQWRVLTGALAKWLKRPVPDWSLPNRLAEEMECKLKALK